MFKILEWVKGKKHSLFPSRKESVVYGEGPEVEAKMQKVFKAKTYNWESTQYEDVRGFGCSIRLLFNSLSLSIHSLFL